jgi:hypothetical protein
VPNTVQKEKDGESKPLEQQVAEMIEKMKNLQKEMEALRERIRSGPANHGPK